MVMIEELWYLVKSVFCVFGFIGGIFDCFMLIMQKEVDVILNCFEENVDKLRLKMLFELGEVICVIDGLFVDFNGVVEEVDYEKSCVKVLVFIFGCFILVDLEFGQVEKG